MRIKSEKVTGSSDEINVIICLSGTDFNLILEALNASKYGDCYPSADATVQKLLDLGGFKEEN